MRDSNSSYIGVDKRRIHGGVYGTQKQYLERLEGKFLIKPKAAIDYEALVIALGPAAWWDAAIGITISGGTSVSGWTSREGNDIELTQGSAGLQPTRNSSNSDFNNLPTVHFDKTAGSVIEISSSYVDTSSTIFLVGKCDGTPDTNGRRIANWGTTGTGNLGVNFSGHDFFIYKNTAGSWGAAGGTSNLDESLFMIGLVMNGGSSYSSVNEGTNVVWAPGASMTASSGTTALGAEGGSTPDWDCAEFIIFDEALSDANFAIVEAYLKQKYNGF